MVDVCDCRYGLGAFCNVAWRVRVGPQALNSATMPIGHTHCDVNGSPPSPQRSEFRRFVWLCSGIFRAEAQAQNRIPRRRSRRAAFGTRAGFYPPTPWNTRLELGPNGCGVWSRLGEVSSMGTLAEGSRGGCVNEQSGRCVAAAWHMRAFCRELEDVEGSWAVDRTRAERCPLMLSSRLSMAS